MFSVTVTKISLQLRPEGCEQDSVTHLVTKNSCGVNSWTKRQRTLQIFQLRSKLWGQSLVGCEKSSMWTGFLCKQNVMNVVSLDKHIIYLRQQDLEAKAGV